MDIKLYKVGGAVRDRFMGVKSKDIDYAVEAPSYQAMQDYISLKGRIFVETPEYFTIRAKVNGEDADFVLCRKDGAYSDGRRPDSVAMGDIYDDLARRDFTMNAIAIAEDGKVIDPYDGISDIVREQIKCVGNPVDRFTEDSLRILRAIRFAITKKFHLHSDIIYALRNVSIVDGLENVSQDRIREELNKCFKCDTLETLRYMEEFHLVREVVFSNKDMWLEATNKSR
jgi:tRNA nucleotidyltransferase (CCA-adding enzyme)